MKEVSFTVYHEIHPNTHMLTKCTVQSTLPARFQDYLCVGGPWSYPENCWVQLTQCAMHYEYVRLRCAVCRETELQKVLHGPKSGRMVTGSLPEFMYDWRHICLACMATLLHQIDKFSTHILFDISITAYISLFLGEKDFVMIKKP